MPDSQSLTYISIYMQCIMAGKLKTKKSTKKTFNPNLKLCLGFWHIKHTHKTHTQKKICIERKQNINAEKHQIPNNTHINKNTAHTHTYTHQYRNHQYQTKFIKFNSGVVFLGFNAWIKLKPIS